VGETPVTITGVYGTLTVNETGHYTYTPSNTMPHSTVNLVDSFTYQIVQPNGVSATATLNVTINVGTGTTSSLMAVEEVNMQGDEAVAATSDDTHHLVGARSAPVAADTHESVAERTAPAEATGLPDAAPDADHADATLSDDVLGELAYQMFEGQGVLENVLSAYLDRQPLPAAADPLATGDGGSESVDLTPVDIPQDPLGYLSTSDDIEKHSANNGHVL
jgi:VCBS repeat-containing protein